MFTEKRFITENTAWKLQIRDLRGSADNRGKLVDILPGEMKSVEKTENQDGSWSLRFCGHEYLGADFSVTARYTPAPAGGLFAALEWNGLPDGIEANEAIFPIVDVPCDDESCFVTGYWNMGWRRRGDIFYKPGESERVNCQSMQFSAVMTTAGSLHIEHQDADWYCKSMDVSRSADGKTLTCGAVFFVPQQSDEKCCRVPYLSRLVSFEGMEPYTSAKLYSQWARQQKWCSKRPEPNGIDEIDMWVWNRGEVDEALPGMLRLAKENPELKFGISWYWWHNNPYDTDYPDFWPPRDGEERFREGVKMLNDANIYSQVYINGNCWDLQAPSWDQGGDDSIVIQENGEKKSCEFNHWNHHRLGFCCGEAPKLADQISKLVKNIHACGLSGQYMDVVGCVTDYLCWNPAHKHPRHGGHYTVDGCRKLVERISVENPNYPITTECANEAYMQYTAGTVVCSSVSAERIGFPYEPLNLYNAVYHGFYRLYGTYAGADGIPPWDPLWPAECKWKEEKPWNKLYPDMFFLDLARSVVWGVQPMVCNVRETLFSDPELAESLQFTIDTAKFYKANKKLLAFAEMDSPEGFSCAEREVVYFQRMIFTAEGDCKELKTIQPAVLHNVWIDDDGKRYLVLANYTGEDQKWQYKDISGKIAKRSYELVSL
ncbi:MAG: hypothetical protein IJZ19_15610 [Lentisphaeria bacterium]|nr:hypothetical protein [Lentisphaeria bacterium]